MNRRPSHHRNMKLARTDSISWSRTTAKHLLNRAGFGGRPTEIADFEHRGPDASVDSLFDFTPQPLVEPNWLAEYDGLSARKFRWMSREEKKDLQKMGRQHVRELQVQWVNRMIASPTPADMLHAKMTFFWHGHFATSAQKVKLPPLLFKQLQFLHENSMGSFRELLQGIARDPAMLRYLDNNQNHKGKPNENFARELMELFSLGPGNYTEKDVKEAARAFTGWTNDPMNFRVNRRKHDYGRKTFLGRSGDFDGEDIINIILEQPACAEFITRKVMHYFGFQSAPDDVVQPIAAGYRASDYRIEVLLRAIFTNSEFYAPKVIGAQIKSPIQLVVGAARTLDADIENEAFYLFALHLMGQLPYFPPNVKGWPGSRAWIDTSRLLTRFTFAEIMSRGEVPAEIDPRSRVDRRREKPSKDDRAFKKMMRGGRLGIDFDPEQLVESGDSPAQMLAGVTQFLLSVEITGNERDAMIENYEDRRHGMDEHKALKLLVGDVMSLPAYQLC